MKIRLRLTQYLAVFGCGVTFLAACNGTAPQSSIEALPNSQILQAPATPFHRILVPDAAKSGIYLSSYHGTSVYGFKSNFKHDHGPMCSVYIGPFRNVNGIAADPEGDLIGPRGSPHSVVVYAGPDLCGPQLGEFSDPFGEPEAAISANAATGTILLADLSGPKHSIIGNIAICTLKSGCTKKLTNPNITGNGSGVALAKNGDCWLTSENAGSTSVAMTYWPGCTGRGEAATGFNSTSVGSLSLDKQGNLVSVDWDGGNAGQLWVYSGCNPACTLVGGPFALEGNPIYGALNATGDTFGTMESGLFGIVDIYKYAPMKLTYEYSFNSGIASAPLGFAYSPALQQ